MAEDRQKKRFRRFREGRKKFVLLPPREGGRGGGREGRRVGEREGGRVGGLERGREGG